MENDIILKDWKKAVKSLTGKLFTQKIIDMRNDMIFKDQKMIEMEND